MLWDRAVALRDAGGHVIESCAFDDLLTAGRMTRTVGSTVRGNRMAARWWGVQLGDTEGTVVVGNAIGNTMRAVDVDGGTLAEVSGNAVNDSDSGCVVQGGASETEVSGNRWERCRIGLIRWDSGTVRHHDNAVIDLLVDDGAIVTGP
jgi:nitrous oxidase accessory protein NosD